MKNNEYDVNKIISDALSIQSSIDLLNEQLEAMKLLLVSLGCDLTELGLEQRDNTSLTETECASLEISGAKLLSPEEFQEGLGYIKPVSCYWWLDSGKQSSPFCNLCVDRENMFTKVHEARVRPVLNVTATKPMIGKRFKYGAVKWTVITPVLAIADSCTEQLILYDSNKLSSRLTEWYEMIRYCSKPEPIEISQVDEQPSAVNSLKDLGARVLGIFNK